MLTVHCSNCKQAIQRYPVHVRNHRFWFCSAECQKIFKSTLIGKKAPQYKGKILRSGYYYIKQWKHPFCSKQGYVAVHRLVMEKHLGRLLKPTEVVHHKNGITTDNRIDNLEVSTGHGKHIMEKHPDTWRKFQAHAFRRR